MQFQEFQEIKAVFAPKKTEKSLAGSKDHYVLGRLSRHLGNSIATPLLTFVICTSSHGMHFCMPSKTEKHGPEEGNLIGNAQSLCVSQLFIAI